MSGRDLELVGVSDANFICGFSIHELDPILDLVPIVSLVVNCFHLISKLYFSQYAPTVEESQQYYSFLQGKSSLRCIYLSIPFSGILEKVFYFLRDLYVKNSEIKNTDTNIQLTQLDNKNDIELQNNIDRCITPTELFVVCDTLKEQPERLKEISSEWQNNHWFIVQAVILEHINKNNDVLKYVSEELLKHKRFINTLLDKIMPGEEGRVREPVLQRVQRFVTSLDSNGIAYKRPEEDLWQSSPDTASTSCQHALQTLGEVTKEVKIFVGDAIQLVKNTVESSSDIDTESSSDTVENITERLDELREELHCFANKTQSVLMHWFK